MNEKNNKYYTPDRIMSVADGIFGFAMTLLVVAIIVPNIADIHNANDLKNALINQTDNIFFYVLSFLLLVNFWMINHEQFSKIKKVDTNFMWLTFYFLLFVVFVPFSANLMGEFNQYFLANAVFAVNLLMLGIINYQLFKYAYSNKLTNETLENDEFIKHKRASLVVPMVALVAILLAFVTPDYSSMIYISIPFIVKIIKKK